MNRIISKPINLWQNGWVDRNENGAYRRGEGERERWVDGRKRQQFSGPRVQACGGQAFLGWQMSESIQWKTDTDMPAPMGECWLHMKQTCLVHMSPVWNIADQMRMLRNRERTQAHSIAAPPSTFSVQPTLTDSGRGLQLTPLTLYAGPHSLSPPNLSISIPPLLAHTQLQPVH